MNHYSFYLNFQYFTNVNSKILLILAQLNPGVNLEAAALRSETGRVPGGAARTSRHLPSSGAIWLFLASS